MAIIWNNSSMSQITGHQNELVTISCHSLSPTSLPFVTIFVFNSAFWGNIDLLDLHVYLHLEETKRGLVLSPLTVQLKRPSHRVSLPSPLPGSFDWLTLLNFSLLSWEVGFVRLFLWMEFCDKKHLFPFNRWVLLNFPRLAISKSVAPLFWPHSFFQCCSWNVLIKIDHIY